MCRVPSYPALPYMSRVEAFATWIKIALFESQSRDQQIKVTSERQKSEHAAAI